MADIGSDKQMRDLEESSYDPKVPLRSGLEYSSGRGAFRGDQIGVVGLRGGDVRLE